MLVIKVIMTMIITTIYNNDNDDNNDINNKTVIHNNDNKTYITTIKIVIRHRFQIVVDFSEKICLSIIDEGQIDRFMKIHGDS